MSLLSIDSLDVFYGEVQALYNVSLHVEPGEIVALVGANGAGKSTTLRTISGILKPARGEIAFDGQPITGCRPMEIVRRGILHVPEGRRIFPGLTVYENLEVAATPWYRSGMDLQEHLDSVFSLFPALQSRQKQLGWSLSGGEQQMLAIGRALMAKPRLILLDEPSLGLAPNLVTTMFEVIQAINVKGTAILLVEQNAFMALHIANRGYVMENGRIILKDTGKALTENARVKEAYLGG